MRDLSRSLASIRLIIPPSHWQRESQAKSILKSRFSLMEHPEMFKS
jgi:hypothetical protein